MTPSSDRLFTIYATWPRIGCVRMDIDGKHRSDYRLWRQLRPERHDGLYGPPRTPYNEIQAYIAAADEWKNDPRNPNAKTGGH